jgi:hypothetical protein
MMIFAHSMSDAAVRTVVLAAFLTTATSTSAAPRIDYNREIRPILSNACYQCHGPDEKKREADLRLDTREGLFAEIDGIHPVVPGNPAGSEIILRISSDDKDEVMPPPKAKKPLKPEQIALIRDWIKQGADFKGHWAFSAPEKPPVPDLDKSDASPLDAFVRKKLTEHGLTRAAEAPREILIRRVTFDLTGLPPTPQEIDAFVNDTALDAYEKVVNRLEASPHYGEHMARYWLDAARYGDTHGLHLDNERSMWPYRDWVVKAFNENLPFDKFAQWQLAGDLLPSPTPDQIIASGFNRCNVTTSEGGSIDAELLVRYAIDRATTASELFMGLTAGCAVCHDHKFDPISQKEFYQLYAFFNSAADPAMDGNIALTPPIYTISTPEQEKQLAGFREQIATVEKRIKEVTSTIAYIDPASLETPPAKTESETVWFDDDFPPGAKVSVTGGADPLTWVTAENGQVLSRNRAIKRTAKGVAQDVFTDINPVLEVPANGKIFVNVWLDPQNPPESVMLQFHTDNWSHRAVWGDIDKIDFGKKGSRERRLIGPLPKAGEWQRLEVDLSNFKLAPGTKFNGFAFTQFGGTVYWDKLGTVFEDDPVNDPNRSQLAWEKANQGKSPKDYPKEIQNIFRSVNPKERTAEQERQLREYYIANIYAGARQTFDPLHKEIADLKKKEEDFSKSLPATLVMHDLEKPRPAHLLVRGQYDKPKDEVQPGTPAFLPALGVPPEKRATRLDLSNWLLSPEHPLMARVTVNRLWSHFFGIGLVRTTADFGSQGEPPVNQELLDWLAVTFRESGWDVKKFVRLIVTSSTYRQDSKATKELLEKDPENRFLARGPRLRLDAEEIRDNALATSGLLVRTFGGKGVKPYQPENIWEPVGFVGSNTRDYKQDHGEALYRRSLYTFWKRTAPPPAMTTFDAPSREQSCTRRERSNTPLQALLLMNDVQQFEASRAFAERIMKEGGTETAARLAWGFRAATGRHPSADELEILSANFNKQLERYRGNEAAAKQVIAVGESKRDEALPPDELAAFTLVANLILNLDEVVTKN